MVFGMLSVEETFPAHPEGAAIHLCPILVPSALKDIQAGENDEAYKKLVKSIVESQDSRRNWLNNLIAANQRNLKDAFDKAKASFARAHDQRIKEYDALQRELAAIEQKFS